MTIQVLGSGCKNCQSLFALTQQAVAELNLEVKVDYITDMGKIIELGVMKTPALAINDQVVMTGFVPNLEKIKHLIDQARTADQL